MSGGVMNKWISAPGIVSRLGGKWRGHTGMCRCPAHEDKSPSLSVSQTRDGRVLVHCFTGCPQASVIAALRDLGLWHGEAAEDASYPGRLTSAADGARSRDDRERRQSARDVWDQARPIAGTVAEQYLRNRGIRMPLGDQLRFHPAMKHGPSKQTFPAMLARISDERGFCAMQRTWIAPDAMAKAPVKPAKMTLGPMDGGAVRLLPAGPRLGLAEGIETAFSAAQIYSIPVWACLSANRLGKINIPETVELLMIFADNGEVGRREAWNAAEEYERRGLRVEIITPDAHFADSSPGDFNDVLRGE